MRTLKVHYAIAKVVGTVLFPVQIFTTFFGGCLAVLTFGLLLLVLTVIWWLLVGPVLLLSWLWLEAERLRFWVPVNVLRLVVSIVGLPLAVVAAAYVQLTPSGDIYNRVIRINMVEIWPYSWDHTRGMGGEGAFWERSDSRTVRRRSELERAWRAIRMGNPYG